MVLTLGVALASASPAPIAVEPRVQGQAVTQALMAGEQQRGGVQQAAAQLAAGGAQYAAAVKNLLASQRLNSPEQRVREVIVFGDSLSDVGTYGVGDIAAVGGGKFTTNNGAVWAETIGDLLGAPVKPFRVGFAGVSQIVGGTGYAMGGSRVSQQPGIGCNPDPQTGACTEALAFPVTQQIGDYLQTHSQRFNSNQLVYVFAGANDIFFQLDVFARSVQAGAPVARAQARALAAVQRTAIELGGQVQRILSKGSARVGVLTLPEIADSIYARKPEQAALRPLMLAMTQLFNSTLAAQLQGTQARLIDIFPEVKRIMATPAQYQVTETGKVACDAAKISALTGGLVQTGDSLFCSSQTLTQPGADVQYLYSDDIHPSTLGHLLLARYILVESVRQGLL